MHILSLQLGVCISSLSFCPCLQNMTYYTTVVLMQYWDCMTLDYILASVAELFLLAQLLSSDPSSLSLLMDYWFYGLTYTFLNLPKGSLLEESELSFCPPKCTGVELWAQLIENMSSLSFQFQGPLRGGVTQGTKLLLLLFRNSGSFIIQYMYVHSIFPLLTE
jgi:hypothetical protein